MITIIIKSFNRPYYLERCIKSIIQMVEGDFEIKVLDDGTPKKYLHKLESKFPKIKFLNSRQSAKKMDAIAENINLGKPIDGFSIPTDLWFSEVKNSTDYVLVIEDDVWFCEKVNLKELASIMNQNNIPLLKLGWLGIYKDDRFCKIEEFNKLVNFVNPINLFTANKFIMDIFMYNKFKFFSILFRLGIVNNTTKQRYWAINSILMGLYRKDYWLEIWKDADGIVDEKQQLRNAAAWFHKNKKVNFARTNQEVLRTTFKSSATGSYHEYGFNFDVNRMNYILNEAWMENDLDSMENFPKDFSDQYIINLLDKVNHPNSNSSEWIKWAKRFKDQYRNLGAEVDN